MTIKKLFVEIGKFIATKAVVLGKLLVEAKIGDIVKVGVLIATVVVGCVIAVKYFKNRIHVYTNDDNKSVLDRALELNFSDLRNQHKLSPLLKEVSKNLDRELKPRAKRKAYRNKKGQQWKEYNKAYQSIKAAESKKAKQKEAGPVALSELRQFEKDMIELEKYEKAHKGTRNNHALKTAWDNA